MAKRTQADPCTFKCGRDVKYPSTGMCGACYVRVRYWTKKTVKQIVDRRRQLEVWERSLDFVAKPKLANAAATRATTKKKRRAA